MKSPLLQGIYLPLWVLGAAFVAIAFTRLVWPMLTRKGPRIHDNLLTVGLFGMVLMLVWETGVYWAIRNIDHAEWMNQEPSIVWTPKLLGVVSMVCALAGVSHAVTGRTRLPELAGLATALWLAGSGLSALARVW